MAAWAAEAPGASGEAFNAVNGDVTRWQTLWPSLAASLGMDWTGPDTCPDGLPRHTVSELAASTRALQAWAALVRRHGLRDVPLADVLPASFLDAVLRRGFDVVSR